MLYDNDNASHNDNGTQLWLAESVSDVVLTCRGRRFHARRDRLASNSAYFRTMFSHAYFAEIESHGIEPHDDDPDALEEMLSFTNGFVLEFASDFELSIPCIREYYTSDDCLLGAEPPLTRGQVIVPKLRKMVSLYILADKYLCWDVCEELTSHVHIEYALQGLFPDFFFGEDEIRPAIGLLQELLQPVYDALVSPRDPLRWMIADFATHYAREEAELADDGNGQARATVLYNALPELKEDTATVELGPPGFDKARNIEAASQARVEGFF